MTDPEASTPRATTADLHKLARAHLTTTSTLFPPKTRGPIARQALNQCGHGLAMLQGEHVVALIDHSAGDGEFVGVVLTDRVLAARLADERLVVPLTRITGASFEEGWLSTTLTLNTRDGDHELAVVRDGDRIARFLKALAAARYAPAERRAPLATASADDPAGLRNLVESLTAPDPRVTALLHLLHGRAEALGVPATADLTARIATLHRTLAFGRPTHAGVWLSAAAPDDLASAAEPLLARGGGHLTRREEGRGFVLDLKLDAADEDEAPADDKATSLQERLQDRIIDRAVDTIIQRVSKRALGGELANLLGDEISAVRLKIEPGPDTLDLIEGGPSPSVTASAASAWDSIKSGFGDVARLLGASKAAPAPTTRRPAPHLAAFSLKARVGRTWRELADADLPRLIAFHDALTDAELDVQLRRTLLGNEPTTQTTRGASDLDLLDLASPHLDARALRLVGLG